METCSTQDKTMIEISTNIEIRSAITGELLCQTENTLTNQGKALIGTLLATTRRIDKIILSEEVSSGETQTFPADALELEITNFFSSISPSTGALTLNFEGGASLAELSGYSTIRTIGLASVSTLTNTAPANFSVGSTPLNALYQIKLTITSI